MQREDSQIDGGSLVRILVDLTQLKPGGESGGIKPALREQFRRLGQNPKNGFIFLYLANHIVAAEVREWMRPVDRLIFEDDASTDIAARMGCHIVYCSFGNTRWACAGIPTLTLVVDTLHRDFPESLPLPDRLYRDEYFRIASERTDLFQVISDQTGAGLIQAYGVPSDRIVRTYLPIHSRIAFERGSLDSPNQQDYFFYPANAWEHKNHATLLVAYALYRKSVGHSAWRLVLTGYMGPAMLKVRKLAHTLCLAEHVEFRGYVNEDEMARLWGGATALAFASLYEGFGMPLLEAMAYGVPIVASDSSTTREITGGAAFLVDGRAPLALAEGLRRMTTDQELGRNLVARGKLRAAQFHGNDELEKLESAIRRLTSSQARWRHTGYHAIDGLVEPVAVFALPDPRGGELHYSTNPLGIQRTIEIYCDAELLRTMQVDDREPSTGQIHIPLYSRTLRFITLDPSRLSPNDPRIHGFLLSKLALYQADGCIIDLLLPSEP